MIMFITQQGIERNQYITAMNTPLNRPAGRAKRPVRNPINITERGLRARRETEEFLNRFFRDNTRGWPVRSGIPTGKES